MSEWPNVQAWKVCVPQGTAGSNPAFSAKEKLKCWYEVPAFFVLQRSKLACESVKVKDADERSSSISIFVLQRSKLTCESVKAKDADELSLVCN